MFHGASANVSEPWQKRSQTRVMLLQIKHTKVSPKLGFYCLEAVALEAHSDLRRKFVEPPQKVHAGRRKTNDFAICFEPEAP